MKPCADPPAGIHASCVCRDGAAVLLLGPPGAGKSDLALRLLARGFALVADDRVVIEAGLARPPPALAGLLEVRGLGIVRLDHVAPVRVVLAMELAPPDAPPERLPRARGSARFGVPVVAIDPRAASAPELVALALDCALGRVAQVAGAFAA
ncbi:MAG: HPr kinase/phosphorylase [Acetobacteraceae bacterium]